MKALKRQALWLLLVALLPLAFALAEPEAPRLLYFYENYCESCSPEEDFIRDFYQLTGQTTAPYDCSFYNISQMRNRQLLDEVVEQYQLPPDKRGLPLLIIGDKIYAGVSGISTALPRDALRWEGASEDSVVLYLYISACESCARAASVLDAMPSEVEVQRGEYLFTSKIRVERIDIGQQAGLALALFDAYNVPEAQRLAPIVFVRGRFFAGIDAIEGGLNAAVMEGQAVGNRVPSLQAPALPLARIGTAALAGFIGGLNPCSLSMLILFTSLLVPMKRRAGLYAAVFLGSKFVTYLLIGTLLLAVIQAWNPFWIAPVLRWLLTAYCAFLLLLNLWDAWSAYRQQYGQIKNQLPSRMRSWLQRGITGMVAHPGKLIPAVLLLGIWVAASEFLCAGQVYLATLLAGVQNGGQNFSALLVYCVAFLLPGGVVAILVLRGKAVFQVSVWLKDRLPLTKLVTALFFAGVLAYLWL